MTVNSVPFISDHVGDGSAVLFAWSNFRVDKEDDLRVSLIENATGTVRVLTSTEYEVISFTEDTGGTIKYPVPSPPTAYPITSAYTIRIERRVPYTQDLDIHPQGGFYPSAVEDQLDRIVMQIQQLAHNDDLILSGDIDILWGNLIGDITAQTDLQLALGGKSNVGHGHVISDVSGLSTALAGKASTSHTHIIGDVSGLQAALDGKAAVSHTHAQSDVTNLVSDLAARVLKAGDTMTGKLILPATSGSSASATLPHGSAPSSPTNGDMWTTISGLYVRVNGVTRGPLLDSVTGLITTVATSDTPPGSPVDGNMWWNSANGQLYVYYDDGNSSQWVSATTQGDLGTTAIEFVIDGGGVPITTGIKGDLHVPFACVLNEWTLLADQTGSIVVDVWADSYANYPPTVADVITASAKPTISAATKGQSSALTGWNTTLAANSTLRFNVNSVSAITRVTISLKATRT